MLGGARSGKSGFAERLAARRAARGRALYLATAEPHDEEMRARIAAHRARRGAHWETLEAPIALAEAVRSHGAGFAAMLVDCLSVWLGNLMHHGRDVEGECAALLAALGETRVPTVVVSAEVGLGVVPDNALARSFRDALGTLNQAVAARAGCAVLVAAGIPLALKGAVPESP